ncbi:MAG: response regulator [Xenococcaceae cyanobacterium]
MKILLVEDDKSLANVVREALTNRHYLVDLATDGQAGWELAESFEYDLILLDLILPKLDGISFCQGRRKMGDRTPILLLTAQDSSTNKVAGLDAGADDYLVKPFDLEELLARIRALLRRGSSPLPSVLEWGDLLLDPSNCQVTYNGQLLHLTAKEYALVELFLRNPHRIFSQSALLDHVWSFEEPPSENAVRTQIKGLRQKLKKAGAAADSIETIYGLGYRLKSRESEVKSQKRGRGEDREMGRKFPIPNPQSQQQTPSGLTAIWERHKDKYLNRIAVLEQAVQRAGNLSEALQQQALREAHTLAGSLGSFGFREASRKCREIERTFQSGDRLSQTQANHLSELIVGLRQELQQSPAAWALPASQSTTIEQQPQLLIVDDDAALAQGLGSEATTWGMQAEVAVNLSQAREVIACTRPDVVLLDLCFPDSAEDGFALLEELTTAQPPVPVLVFTAQESFADRVKVARLGGRGFLQKPVSTTQVMEAIAQVLQQASPSMAKLLVVDDDPQMLDFLLTLLGPWGFELTLLDDPQKFWGTLEQSVPDLLILDVEMPEFSGIDLCQVVRNDPRWNDLPILFLSVHTDAETVQRVFAAGADDYVHKPIVEPELIARVLNRIERSQLRHQLAAERHQFQ